jgi:SAM-dependent methyltransferase
MRYRDINSESRHKWLLKTLSELPKNLRILDAGAGRLRNKPLCGHLNYESQDFCQLCQYDELGDSPIAKTGKVDPSLTSKIDFVCDITSIPQPDACYDIILCTEVLEHVPDPTLALDEFARLLKSGGVLILTAPFASMVHLAPYHYCSGFSRYWYEHHLPLRGFHIKELTPNGDWFSYFYQELMRLGKRSRHL